MSIATEHKSKFLEMPFADYLDLAAVNQSSLKPMITRSPLHYRCERAATAEPRPAQVVGTFTHALCLEPEALIARYVVEPTARFKDEARTKDGGKPKTPANCESFRWMREEFRLANIDKKIVTQDVYDQVAGMSRAVWAHGSAREQLHRAQLRERVMLWTDAETGLRCKARVDAVNIDEHVIADLKTTADIFTFGLQKWQYDVQAAFHADGYEQITGRKPAFYLIAVESQPPYCVRAAFVGRVALMIGRRKYKQALRDLALCQQRDEWPGPADPGEWSLPDWEISKYL